MHDADASRSCAYPGNHSPHQSMRAEFVDSQANVYSQKDEDCGSGS